MWYRLWNVVLSGVALASLVACKVQVPSSVEVVGTTSLTCVATVTNGTVFTSGEPVIIRVTAENGTTPYSLSGVGNFSASTSVTRTYTNQTANQIVITDQISISDSQGRGASCSFQANISPSIVNPGSLSCQMVGSVESVLPNQTVTYNMVANGSGAITFHHFQAGDSGVVVSPLTTLGAISAAASVSYTSMGTKTASVLVSDSLGNVAACTDSTLVRGQPSMTVVASPGASVSVGSSIHLVAYPTGFVSTPSITFTTPEPGVVITSTSSTSARVDAVDGNTHAAFLVSVIASGALETAQSSTTLSFTANASTLNCEITYPAGTYRAGDTVNIDVTASEPLVVTNFSVPGGEVLESFAAFPARVRYRTSGVRLISATARGATSGRLCNSGATLIKTISIEPASTPVSCSVLTYSNPSYISQWFTVNVTPGISTGYLRIYQIDATRVSTGGAASGEWQNGSSRYVAQARMFESGTFQLTVTLIDELSGNTTSCSTQHQVMNWWY